MKEFNKDIDEQMKEIEKNIEYIKKNLPTTEGPIFIELMGTPKSGKTTLMKCLKNVFDKNGISYEAKRETAEYNPIEDKDLEEYNIWMIMELMKSLSEDLSNKSPRIIIYDRGMLDRLPWLDFSVQDGTIPINDSMLFKQLFNTEFMQKYKPLSYGMVTSPDLSVKRKGGPGKIVTHRNIAVFNACFAKQMETISGISRKITITETDPYQGKIKEFIMDMTEYITRDVAEIVKERAEIDVEIEEEIAK